MCPQRTPKHVCVRVGHAVTSGAFEDEGFVFIHVAKLAWNVGPCKLPCCVGRAGSDTQEALDAVVGARATHTRRSPMWVMRVGCDSFSPTARRRRTLLDEHQHPNWNTRPLERERDAHGLPGQHAWRRWRRA